MSWRKALRRAPALVAMLVAGLLAPVAMATTLVVPFAAGGPSDQLARRIAQGIQKMTGEPAPAVLNVPGALAAYERFRSLASRPDAAAGGPVLFLADLDAALVLQQSAGVDITTALVPIALLGHRPLAVYAAAAAMSRSGSGRLCATRDCRVLAAPGPASQRCAANLARQLDLAPSQVLSYRATAAAVADVHRIPDSLLCMASLPPAAAAAQGLQVLAWGAPTRLVDPARPAPVLAELGLQPLSHTFVGLFAGPDLAPDAMDRLAAAVHRVLADPGFRSWVLGQGSIEPAQPLLAAD